MKRAVPLPRLYLLTGETAIGQTELARAWVEANDGEIITLNFWPQRGAKKTTDVRPVCSDQPRRAYGRITSHVPLGLDTVRFLCASLRPILRPVLPI